MAPRGAFAAIRRPLVKCMASTLRAGERLTTLTSPPLDQNVQAPCQARAPPVAPCPRLALDVLLAYGKAYGRESPARSHGNPMTRAQR